MRARHAAFLLAVCVVALLAPAAWADLDNSPAIAHDCGSDATAFGVALTQTVAAGGSYAGLSSYVAGLDSSGTEYLGSRAVILAGTNTGGETVVSMAWRNRTVTEAKDTYVSQSPPLAFDAYNNTSDVVALSGIQGPYVLQMDYDESTILFDPGLDEMDLWRVDDAYGKGRIYLGWLNPHGPGTDDDQWEYATYGNSYTGALAVENYLGSFASFLSAHPDFNFSQYMGSYGVDIVNDEVWAVLDHNTAFGAIPEPSTLGLVLAGALGLLVRRRWRR